MQRASDSGAAQRLLGTVLAALDEAGVAKDTVVIFTSDNGCSPEAKFDELRAKGHDPSAGFRGHKADIFEGGHRVPFIVSWPGKVKPGTSSADIVCLTDFMATAAEIVGAKIPANAAEDSISFLPALMGKDGPKRTALVSHSINGSFAIREGNMKLALCAGSGGWSAPKPGTPAENGLPQDQLYDLAADRAESKNLAGKKNGGREASRSDVRQIHRRRSQHARRTAEERCGNPCAEGADGRGEDAALRPCSRSAGRTTRAVILREKGRAGAHRSLDACKFSR